MHILSSHVLTYAHTHIQYLYTYMFIHSTHTSKIHRHTHTHVWKDNPSEPLAILVPETILILWLCKVLPLEENGDIPQDLCSVTEFFSLQCLEQRVTRRQLPPHCQSPLLTSSSRNHALSAGTQASSAQEGCDPCLLTLRGTALCKKPLM